MLKVLRKGPGAIETGTLIASIYGMNFHHMPALDWRAGYPMALFLMLISAAIPLWWFRRKGWL